MAMKRYRFTEQQKAEYNRRVKEYANERYFLKDARAMARRDVENMLCREELELENKRKGVSRWQT